ncbi:MAG TPA: type II toxin-antitoxin system VapC family toxin [Gemmatimonadota bacterium]|nr:type II toxin-antitoxin system VapC family toxin [Gemmatimonadota bacterium]
MRSIVADASALVEYLLRTARAEAIGGIVENPDVDLHVPALCDVEVAAALRRTILSGRMSVERAERAVEDYLDLPLVRHGHERLLAAILRLRSNFSAYDAAYVALAVGLGAALLTGDRRLHRAVRRHTDVSTV